MLSITLDKRPLAELAGMFPKAGASALNKMATQSKSEASRQVRVRYNIKKGDLDSNFRIVRATERKLEAQVRASGKRLPLYDFGARQTNKGVSVMVVKGQRKVVTGSFVATMPTGHVGVFQRKTRKRLPIHELTTVSVPEMFGSKNVMEKLKGFVGDKLRGILEHEIEYFASKGR